MDSGRLKCFHNTFIYVSKNLNKCYNLCILFFLLLSLSGLVVRMEWDHFTATILVHSDDQKFGYEA